MSGIGDAEWVRIDESALEPGMTVRGRAGERKSKPFLLFRRALSTGRHTLGPRAGTPCPVPTAWETTAHPTALVCFCVVALQGGWIERLRDLGDADEICRRAICDLDDLKRASQRKRVGFPLAGRAR